MFFKILTIDTFILRQGKARISPILIKYMMSLFKNKGDQYKVNKSFDNFQNPKANPDNVRTYKTILMPLRDAGLIEPVNAPSLWNSLYKETAVRLTSLGQYIWQLRKNGTI